jgi:NADH-quinone oxidoreductase subunit L
MGVTLALIAASVFAAWKLYGNPGKVAPDEVDPLPKMGAEFFQGSYNKWYVDELYELVLLKPLQFLSEHVLHPIVDVLFIDGAVNGAAKAATGLGRAYGQLAQTGRIPAYALAVAGGTAIMVFLFAAG